MSWVQVGHGGSHEPIGSDRRSGVGVGPSRVAGVLASGEPQEVKSAVVAGVLDIQGVSEVSVSRYGISIGQC